jgi:hypothetical protein
MRDLDEHQQMKSTNGVIAALIHMLIYRANPVDDVEMLGKAILKGGFIVFNRDEVEQALREVQLSNDDLSTALAQPHTDAVLRKVFADLLAFLTSRPNVNI